MARDVANLSRRGSIEAKLRRSKEKAFILDRDENFSFRTNKSSLSCLKSIAREIGEIKHYTFAF